MSFGVRLSIIATAFIALFGVLALRLWDMQLIEAEAYQDQADSNLVRFVETPAPRGEIRDAQGRLIAGTRPALAAVVEGALLPDEDDDDELIARLAAFSGLPAAEVDAILTDARDRGDRITLVAELNDEQSLFLVEHDELFPGASVVPQPIRVYEQGDLVPHVVGFIGRPDAADLEKSGISPRDLLGKAGVEREYDDILRGAPGLVKYQVNAQGQILDTLGEQAPSPGSSLRLEIDLDVQSVLSTALSQGLQSARLAHAAGGCEPGDDDPGCPVRAVGVVLDAKTGAVRAMSSVPSYDPNAFVGGVTQDELDALPEGVFNNFAIQGEYAPASTFKAVTYVTAFENDLLPRTESFLGVPTSRDPTLDDDIQCSAQLRADFTDRSQLVWRNWKRADDGPQNIHRALVRSCNIYFWDVALNLWNTYKGTPLEDQLQDWANDLGFGDRTGIDLPFERPGIVPDRELFEAWAEEQENGGPRRLDPARLELATPWLGGDLLQAAVGQGSVLVTPLQLAVGYAAMVNGGTVWEPRVVQSVEGIDGRTLLVNAPRASNTVEVAPDTLLQLRRDLQQVVNNPEGTAAAAFEAFGSRRELVGGKTGTAQVIRARTLEDGTEIEPVNTALFAGVAPIDDPQWVVVTVIERGGSGGAVAAPTAVPVLEYLLKGRAAVGDVRIGLEFLD